jgi:carotenoid cleavage dioxygenase-like enzyme
MVDGITRRRFKLLAAGTAVAGLGLGVRPATALETADIGWTSDDPHLSGNFASIGPEIDAADLPVIAGRIPPELNGAYMRNGPNPLYKPISYSYPMDGDGMIHAVYLSNGRARYRNRFVNTHALTAERRAGRAIYGGFLHPMPVDPALVTPIGDPGPFKNGAFINVIQHGGHLLALDEATTGYEITADLETLGEWRAGTDKPIRLGAHNRRHPKTGALFAIAYSNREAAVQIHQIGATGVLANSFSLPLTAPTMIHDFVLTEKYIVLLVCPAVFDIQSARAGKPELQWRPELGTRIGLIALDGSSTLWIDADPFFVFHFGNAFERGGHVFIDYVRHDSLTVGYSTVKQKIPTLHRMDISLATRKINDVQIADMVVEFPRTNDALNALPTRFVFVPTLTDTLRLTNPPSATFNTMLKVNTETGAMVRHDFGNRIAGEAAFIPRESGGSEDDGYLAIFAYDPTNKTSDFILLDAAHIDAEPVAVIRLPQRVPQGLHGNWIPRV